jgi:hypothetical protein
MIKQKRGSAGIWILVILILILIVAGVVVYFWITSKEDFPQTLGGYTLQSNSINDETECGEIEGNQICVQTGRAVYVNSDNRAVHVLTTKITSNRENYVDYFKTHASEENVESITGVYRGAEPWEIYWFTNRNYDFILIRDYKYSPQADGSINAQTLNATASTPVTQWFLEHYPPKLPR